MLHEYKHNQVSNQILIKFTRVYHSHEDSRLSQRYSRLDNLTWQSCSMLIFPLSKERKMVEPQAMKYVHPWKKSIEHTEKQTSLIE